VSIGKSRIAPVRRYRFSFALGVQVWGRYFRCHG
jgi:hypothetical protein